MAIKEGRIYHAPPDMMYPYGDVENFGLYRRKRKKFKSKVYAYNKKNKKIQFVIIKIHGDCYMEIGGIEKDKKLNKYVLSFFNWSDYKEYFFDSFEEAANYKAFINNQISLFDTFNYDDMVVDIYWV